MDKRRVHGICRILYAVGIAVKVIAIYVAVFATLGVVNGGRWLMMLPLGISIAVLVIADELLDATEKRLK